MAFKNTNTRNDKFTYEVMEECGTVATNGDWKMKLRLMKWNGGPEKYDLRYWKIDDTGNEICKKGITFTTEEIEGLQKLLNKINNEEVM